MHRFEVECDVKHPSAIEERSRKEARESWQLVVTGYLSMPVFGMSPLEPIECKQCGKFYDFHWHKECPWCAKEKVKLKKETLAEEALRKTREEIGDSGWTKNNPATVARCRECGKFHNILQSCPK